MSLNSRYMDNFNSTFFVCTHKQQVNLFPSIISSWWHMATYRYYFQYWLSSWLAAWQHQAMTWTNVDSSYSALAWNVSYDWMPWWLQVHREKGTQKKREKERERERQRYGNKLLMLSLSRHSFTFANNLEWLGLPRMLLAITCKY